MQKNYFFTIDYPGTRDQKALTTSFPPAAARRGEGSKLKRTAND